MTSIRPPTLVISLALALLAACGDANPVDPPGAGQAGATAGGPGGARRPNIVLISIDTLRADALEPWGAARPTSPNISRLASESWVFENAYSQAGVTAPAHMTLLTSLYPTVHGVSNLSVSGKERAEEERDYAQAIHLDPKVKTLAGVLAENGWRTAGFTSGGNLSSELGFDQGFHEYGDAPSAGVNGNDGPWFDAGEVEAWLAQHAREPFFLFVHTWIPHMPYLPKPPWDTAFDPDYRGPIVSSRAAFDALGEHADEAVVPRGMLRGVDRKDPIETGHVRALYDGDVRYADEAVGELLAVLEQAGVMDDTILVLVSDHGEQFLEHGAFGHPAELWTYLVHVPLIIRMPTREARTFDATVRLIDVMPTLLDLVDVSPPPELQGRSLLPLLEGPLEEVPTISEIVTRWKYDGVEKTPHRLVRAIRSGNWTYVKRSYYNIRTEELYDRSSDPGEKLNLAPKRKEHAETLKRFRDIDAKHEAACETLSARFVGTRVEVSDETLEEIGKLGYVR